MAQHMNGRRTFLRRSASAAALLLIDPRTTFALSARDFDPAHFTSLADAIDGVVVTPDHEAYASARRTASFNPRFDHRPLAMVGCKSEADISRAILFARQHELPVSVRSGGHDVLAASVLDGGLVIDTRYLVESNFSGHTGRMSVGAGAVAGAVNQAAGVYGRAVPLGCNSAVGVSGLTLGGGLGWFIASHGATCDHVFSARIISTSGELLVANRSQHADLYWGIRGGGGNFGVVSEWTFETHEQGDVVCGGIVYPGSQSREFLQFYQDFMETAPDELTVEVIGNAYHRPMIAAAVCYSGHVRDANEVLAPLREFGKPLADGFVVRPYAELENLAESIVPYVTFSGPREDSQPLEPGSYWQGTTVSSLNDAVIDAIVDAIDDAPPGWSFGLGHVMRGACLAVADDDTPLLRQAGATTVHFDGGWSHRLQAPAVMTWVDDATRRLSCLDADTPTYVNYLSTNDPDAVRQSYGRNFERLARLKRKYDPDNILNQNRNIRPSRR